MSKKKYQDISYQVSTFEGIPVMETITAQEQKDFVENGYGTVNDLIEMNQLAYRDWQADC
jgi:hypothetical protein